MKKLFKSHNTLGFPLCPSCGSNPRKKENVRCGRCWKEDRPIQWDRIEESTRSELVAKGLKPL